VTDSGKYGVEAAGPKIVLLDDHVTEIVDEIDVVTVSALHDVGATIAIDEVIAAAADHIRRAPRAFAGSDTAVGEAMDAALALFADVPDCKRRIIDISGDGPENMGNTARAARVRAMTAGVAINAIAIEDLGQSTAITRFYLNWVITKGGFVVTSRGLSAYPAAIRQKLLRELEKPAS